MAANVSDTVVSEAENDRMPNSEMSSDGWSLRISSHRNRMRIAKPPMIAPDTPRLSQSWLSPPCRDPADQQEQTGDAHQQPERVEPAGLGLLDSGTSRRIPITPIATIGTLIRNTEPHQKCSSETSAACPSATAP